MRFAPICCGVRQVPEKMSPACTPGRDAKLVWNTACSVAKAVGPNSSTDVPLSKKDLGAVTAQGQGVR